MDPIKGLFEYENDIKNNKKLLNYFEIYSDESEQTSKLVDIILNVCEYYNIAEKELKKICKNLNLPNKWMRF